MNDNSSIYPSNMEDNRRLIDAKYPSRPTTDVGNSLRFTDLATGKMLWVPEAGMWFYWDGLHWVPDEMGTMYSHYVFKVYQQILDESNAVRVAGSKLSAQCEDEAQRKALEKHYTQLAGHIKVWWEKSQGVGHYFAIGSLSAQHITMGMPYGRFDINGQMIGVANGILDPETFQLLTGDLSLLISKSINVEYHHDAVCPAWDKFILMVTQGNEDEIKFLQRLAGLCLLGIPKDKLAILFGESGANGKTTFAETLCRLLGDYGQKCPTRMLLQDNSNKEYYLAELKGKRMISMNEVKADAHLADDLIKMVLDSGTIVGRKLRRDPFAFAPVFTPILTVNKMPGIGAEDALWRRVVLMEFKHQVPEQERNTDFIHDRLESEFSGILNWCLDGLKQYRVQGLNPPASVVERTDREKEEQDQVKQFLEQVCVIGAQHKVPFSKFRSNYSLWCDDNGVKPLGLRSIKSYLASKGYHTQTEGANVLTVYRLKVNEMRCLG
jgi:putative DNA primase/helicase